MKADTTVTITPAVISDWENDAARREKQAAELIAEAKNLRARAEAGKLLLGLAGGAEADAAEGEPGVSMMEAMETIANSADKPMTKATIKSRLQILGFSEEQMGSYFYTCVARLKAKKRITVTDDGRMWKGETAS
jgi:hypothetical protein